MFYGRQQELSFLEKKFHTPGSQLLALYGRRRTGKTQLLKRFCENKEHSFYVCRETTDAEQIRLFSRKILEGSPLGQYIDTFESWEKAFSFLMEESRRQRRVLVIDEFPYMVQNNPSVPSVLQQVWDQGHQDSQLMLIITGSAMTTMEQDILGGDSPLFGRTDGIFQVDELSMESSLEFLGGSSRENIRAWALLGGVPRYLKAWDTRLSLEENLETNVLSKGSMLYSEVEFLMKQDLRETSTYFTILEALARGEHRIGEISRTTGLDRTKINVYLKNLMGMGVVDRIYPLPLEPGQEPGPHSSSYRISNHFFRFHFRFIYPNYSLLEENEVSQVLDQRIRPHLAEFIGESLIGGVRERIRSLSPESSLPFIPLELDPYWDKDTSLDLVATNGAGQLLAVGIHAEDQPATLAQLELLREKTYALRRPGWQKTCLLASLSGFDETLVRMSRLDESIILLPIE